MIKFQVKRISRNFSQSVNGQFVSKGQFRLMEIFFFFETLKEERVLNINIS